jgi:hydrogenase maturation protein HypF
VASLCGVRQVVNYEAQAAIEFEALADPNEHCQYDFNIEAASDQDEKYSQIDPTPLIKELLDDIDHSVPIPVISARFHRSIARMVGEVCSQLRREYDVDQVVLSGGVWQNMTLLQLTLELLSQLDFKVYIHHQVPTNDGGLALGQLAVAAHRMAAT